MTIAKRIRAKVFSIILSSVEIEPTEDARLLAIHQMDSDELLFEQIRLHDILMWYYCYTSIRIPLETDFYCGSNYSLYLLRIARWHGRREPLRRH